MKCPHCDKEIEVPTLSDSPAFRRLFLSSFVIFLSLGGLPWDIEHGYSANYDLITALILIVIFNVGMWLYYRRKTKWKKKKIR